MSVRVLTFEPGKEPQLAESMAALDSRTADTPVWIDVESDSPDELNELARRFNLHELSVEDCLTPGHPPKLERYGSYVFIVLRAMRSPAELDDIRADHAELRKALSESRDTVEEPIDPYTTKVSIFLSDRYIISFRRREVAWLDALVRKVCTDWEDYEDEIKPDLIAYWAVDALVDRFLRGLLFFERIIDKIEAGVVRAPEEFELGGLLDLKQEVSSLLQVARQQRAVTARLAGDPALPIAAHRHQYFKDVDDHAMDGISALEKQLDAIHSVRDLYFASTNVRLSDTMRILAVITTLAAPLNIVVGMYGMNFEAMPLLHSPHGFWFITSVMVILAFFMILYFRRRDWL